MCNPASRDSALGRRHSHLDFTAHQFESLANLLFLVFLQRAEVVDIASELSDLAAETIWERFGANVCKWRNAAAACHQGVVDRFGCQTQRTNGANTGNHNATVSLVRHFQKSVLGFSVLGFSVLGFSVLGFSVLGFSVLGFSVLGFSVSRFFRFSVFRFSVFRFSVFRFSVFRFSVFGSRFFGSRFSVLGFSVLGFSVLGFSVLGFSVLGFSVLGFSFSVFRFSVFGSRLPLVWVIRISDFPRPLSQNRHAAEAEIIRGWNFGLGYTPCEWLTFSSADGYCHPAPRPARRLVILAFV